jgi:hypothetical protein
MYTLVYISIVPFGLTQKARKGQEEKNSNDEHKFKLSAILARHSQTAFLQLNPFII